ncbi:ParB family chromosome partitioning protein [Stenotrophomonas sp. PvP093]|uniref:ParB/RepB/Spo0J family partition protein n=1 Tax=unclassified Stenotrophomonas TaxID=196198 RepID=UPI001AEABC97|nr:ParB/RepB/Spo0J family partition protein [Stenotrophomonas sp. PvP093]MBP2480167.1 ParB family chromosome partitioning protein [Stenotrophomonas sp. PvP093]
MSKNINNIKNTITVRVSDLVVSPRNVRYKSAPPSAAKIEATADNIIAIGCLIHDPIVELMDDGVYGVVAGRTRLLALQHLIADGRLPEDHEIDVDVVPQEMAEIVSTSENTMREDMHPLDEFRAYASLVKSGKTIEAIALAFGTTPLSVERRLKLAAVAPELLESYRESDSPNLEQLSALASTDDHGRQIEVWNARKYSSFMNGPTHLRDALNSGKINVKSDRRLTLVSVAEYEAAGGEVQSDLFSDNAYLLNGDLFLQLVEAKMQNSAAEVQSEGWAWVEVVMDKIEEVRVKYGRTNAVRRDPTPDDIARLDAINERVRIAIAAYEAAEAAGFPEDNEYELSDAVSEAEQEVDDYPDSLLHFTAEQRSYAGALVFLDYDGELMVERGYVRREDRRSMDEATRQTKGAEVIGGRETDDAGRRADALSQTMVDELHGHRILAVQKELAKNPRVAKVMQAVWAIGEISGGSSLLEMSIHSTWSLRSRLRQLGGGVKQAAEEFYDALEKQVGTMPDDAAALWACLMDKSDAELDAIIAMAIAKAVAPKAAHDGLTACLLDSLGFDMADHFTATPENFTSRVTKKIVSDALQEAEVGEGVNVDGLRKGDLASLAAERLKGTRWVPAIIRTPARAPIEPPKPGKSAAKKAPAKKAPVKAPSKKK